MIKKNDLPWDKMFGSYEYDSKSWCYGPNEYEEKYPPGSISPNFSSTHRGWFFLVREAEARRLWERDKWHSKTDDLVAENANLKRQVEVLKEGLDTSICAYINERWADVQDALLKANAIAAEMEGEDEKNSANKR